MGFSVQFTSLNSFFSSFLIRNLLIIRHNFYDFFNLKKFQNFGADPIYPTPDGVSVIDCTGKTVIPGFVDAHTHPVFDGDRANEFAMKLAGAGYMEIHAAGGGIHYTVRATREASEDVLFEKLQKRLDNMVDHGTLVMEAKSGYGLDVETEMKMLRVIKRAKQ